MGIRHIGLENAKLLAKHFTSFSNFQNLSKKSNYDDLLNIDGIGETQVNSIKSFFANDTNTKVLKELEKYLVINNASVKQNNGILNNKSFLVTGKLNGMSRAEIKSLIEENSGNTVSTVSNKLDYLITGEKPTKRKVENAKQLNIKIINQNQFLHPLVSDIPLPGSGYKEQYLIQLVLQVASNSDETGNSDRGNMDKGKRWRRITETTPRTAELNKRNST